MTKLSAFTTTVIGDMGNCNCCGCGDNCKLFFATNNCNSITDDDLEIYVNGTLVSTFVETDTSCNFGICRGHLLKDATCSANYYEIYGNPGFGTCICPTNLVLTYHTYDLSEYLDCETYPTLTIHLLTSTSHGCGDYLLFYSGAACGCDSTITWTDKREITGFTIDQEFTITNPCCQGSFGTITNGIGPPRSIVTDSTPVIPFVPSGDLPDQSSIIPLSSKRVVKPKLINKALTDMVDKKDCGCSQKKRRTIE